MASIVGPFVPGANDHIGSTPPAVRPTESSAPHTTARRPQLLDWCVAAQRVKRVGPNERGAGETSVPLRPAVREIIVASSTGIIPERRPNLAICHPSSP